MKTTFPEKAKKFFTSWEFVLLLILFAEIVIFATKNPKFLMPRVLFGSLNDIISICIISLFVTFVMITGGIDIQAGSIVGLSSIVLGVAWQDGGMNIWEAASCLQVWRFWYRIYLRLRVIRESADFRTAFCRFPNLNCSESFRVRLLSSWCWQ